MSPRAASRLEAMGFEQVYDYVAGKADWLAMGLRTEGAIADEPRAHDLARRDVPTCRLGDDLRSVCEMLAASGWDTCMVVNDRGVLLGRIGRRTLAARQGTIEEAMTEGPSTVRPNRADCRPREEDAQAEPPLVAGHEARRHPRRLGATRRG